jgi:hypothetical protein
LRPIVLIVVLALHFTMLALLLTTSRTLRIAGSAAQPPVELVFLPAQKAPKVRVENNPPRRLSTDVALTLAPPLLTSLQTGSASEGHGSASDGHGSGVNWVAEAHRAVRAYEIRRDQSKNSALSVSSTPDEQGSREHHAGDQQKTADGDWIVWINANCYQVASWHSGSTTLGAISPQPICRAPRAAPHGD